MILSYFINLTSPCISLFVVVTVVFVFVFYLLFEILLRIFHGNNNKCTLHTPYRVHVWALKFTDKIKWPKSIFDHDLIQRIFSLFPSSSLIRLVTFSFQCFQCLFPLSANLFPSLFPIFLIVVLRFVLRHRPNSLKIEKIKHKYDGVQF